MSAATSRYFETEIEAFAFAEGLEIASHGDIHSVEVMIPFDGQPYVVWTDEQT